jgi:hypothetical protein
LEGEDVADMRIFVVHPALQKLAVCVYLIACYFCQMALVVVLGLWVALLGGVVVCLFEGLARCYRAPALQIILAHVKLYNT